MTARVRNSFGLDAVGLGIFATALVKEKVIDYRFYTSPFQGPDHTTRVLNKHKANVAAFLVENTSQQ